MPVTIAEVMTISVAIAAAEPIAPASSSWRMDTDAGVVFGQRGFPAESCNQRSHCQTPNSQANRQLDKQDSYSGYLRISYLLADQKYRPYIAFAYKGYGDYIIDTTTTANGSHQMVLTPGIDFNLAGDFSSEIKFDYTLAGSGNHTIATPTGWKISANVKYFWFRF